MLLDAMPLRTFLLQIRGRKPSFSNSSEGIYFLEIKREKFSFFKFWEGDSLLDVVPLGTSLLQIQGREPSFSNSWEGTSLFEMKGRELQFFKFKGGNSVAVCHAS